MLNRRMMGSVTRDRFSGHRLEHAEVHANDDRDKDPQQHQELALRDEVGLAGFVDQFGDFAHGAMHGQVLEAHVDGHAEAEAEQAKQDSDQQQLVAVDRIIQKADGRKVRQLEGGLTAAGLFGGLGEGAGGH